MPCLRRRVRSLPLAAACVLLAACGHDMPPPAYGLLPVAHQPTAAALSDLGRRLFFDASLSASGRVSCASCHDPAHAYGPPDSLSIQPGDDGLSHGLRAAPSLRYLQAVPPFSEHYQDDDGNDAPDAGPTGGRMWDGRADSAHAQAVLPLLGRDEMANRDAASVQRRLQAAPYAGDLRRLFGAQVLADAGTALDAAAMALEVFEESPADFAPYSSRYDAMLRGRAMLDAQEARGLAVFEDPARGNCATCHPSRPSPEGAFPLFTDFGLVALGAPRNPAIAANADPAFFDLGLGGPLRTDFLGRPEACGRFRTPTLRNVAVRGAFFHNGVFHRLDEVLRFYAERDTAPGRFYRGGTFDDLPPACRTAVDREPPFGGRPGKASPLSDTDLRDLEAFLRTLTDADLVQRAVGGSVSSKVSTKTK